MVVEGLGLVVMVWGKVLMWGTMVERHLLGQSRNDCRIDSPAGATTTSTTTTTTTAAVCGLGDSRPYSRTGWYGMHDRA